MHALYNVYRGVCRGAGALQIMYRLLIFKRDKMARGGLKYVSVVLIIHLVHQLHYQVAL